MIEGIADALWENPETCFEEFEAVRLLTGILEEHGFSVETELAGIPTAFKATYGNGGPHLGILAEYDGLSGLSQEADIAEKRPIPGTDVYDPFFGCAQWPGTFLALIDFDGIAVFFLSVD